MIVNLTPHDIVIVLENGLTKRYPASGVVARVSDTRELTGYVDGVPVYVLRPGPVTGLPEPREGTYFLVSRQVALALAGRRDDLLVPEDLVRDEAGRVTAARAFARF